MEPVVITPASRKDAYTLLVLSRTFFAYASFTTDKIERRLRNPRVQYLVARVGNPADVTARGQTPGRTAGFLDYATYGTHAKILGVAVLPEFRRQGIARQLVKRALEDIRNLKRADGKPRYASVFLMAEPDNTPALALYESFGFRKHRDSRKRLYGKPLIILKKQLS